MKIDYKGYFQDHYLSNGSQSDILRYKRWFCSQWEIIKNKVSVRSSMRVLEIGSGLGGFYSILREEGVVDYLGIELDEYAVVFAKNFFESNVFRHSSIEDFEDEDGFDLIFSFEVLEHVENPSKVIEKIYHLLRPGGVFCGTSPYPYKKNILADKTHISVLHPLNWQRLFENADFSSVHWEPMTFFPFLWRIDPRINIRFSFFLSYKHWISTCLIIARKK